MVTNVKNLKKIKKYNIIKTLLPLGYIKSGFINGGKVYYLNESEDFVISDRSGWLPGVYKTEDKAILALNKFNK